jgi:hypothetical protein
VTQDRPVDAMTTDYRALPSGYIDPEHKGEDLALLETFYRACLAEGGTVNEIELRGIRAVLATHSTPQPPADGELTVNLRMDLSSECLKRLCDGLAAAVIPNGGYRELTTDDDISGEFIGEQQVSVTWWLPEHGCDSLENTLDAIKGRLCAAVRDWLPTAVTATPQPPPQPEPAPVAVSERPWERDGWGEVPMPMWDYGRDLAAALRSAAEQLSYKNELGLTHFGGHCQARDQLLAIASELEGNAQ